MDSLDYFRAQLGSMFSEAEVAVDRSGWQVVRVGPEGAKITVSCIQGTAVEVVIGSEFRSTLLAIDDDDLQGALSEAAHALRVVTEAGLQGFLEEVDDQEVYSNLLFHRRQS